ncbi:MAG TPA: hypothetical protein VHD76_22110 [Bryobacteraceae bacterium]|nr:hypothetical protein [Bryobacteraceae bacterium]
MKWAILPLAFAVLLSGCKKDIQNESAVKAGILKYLAKRTDLSEMDVSVSAVSFQQKEANATVHFQAKGTTNPAEGLEMKYILERQGDEWVVKGREGGADRAAGMGANPHGLAADPHGMGATLPPGHPAIPPGEMPVTPGTHPQTPAGTAK